MGETPHQAVQAYMYTPCGPNGSCYIRKARGTVIRRSLIIIVMNVI